MIPTIIVLSAVVVILIYLFINKLRDYKEAIEQIEKLELKYKDIIDIQKEVEESRRALARLESDIADLKLTHDKKQNELNNEYSEKRKIYESLLKEVSILEENLEDISYGLYKPHFDYSSSDEFKKSLEFLHEKQKQLIKQEGATFCPVSWTVEGSAAKGTKMIKEASKLMLRAFNGECDAAISKVTWSNIANMEARIQKAYEALNKLGSTNQISITEKYLKLKLEELYLEYELEEKLYKEKEQQKRIREEMREEEKALKELEKATREAEVEEERYQKALDKARADILQANEQELEKLNEKIKLLEENLQKAKVVKERAISQAQLTKSGHVYIISNIGSFGDKIFKIGMTRRLEPMDRIKELGDASVPFDFDVHCFIYSENAPELEYTIQKKLEHKKMNLVNSRDEFFKTSIDELESILKEMNINATFSKIPEAREFRESLSIREAIAIKNAEQEIDQKSHLEELLDRFPTTL